ncbi:MAG TPA: adenylyl-sulfate kinase [Cytophagales bacterium]|nr:adenylyl-sulfate kinase [Cytophagales bacterium]
MNSNVLPQAYKITKADRLKFYNQKPMVIWFTGLSGSGKSTIANLLEQKLYNDGCKTYVLDGDNIRNGLNKDLTFSSEDRKENIRRIGEVSKLMVDAGLIVISAFISPFESDRIMVRDLFEEGEFLEVFIDCPLDVCETRDVKGLYQKARKGLIKDFTGIDSPFETPENPEITIHSAQQSVTESVSSLYNFLLPRVKSF